MTDKYIEVNESFLRFGSPHAGVSKKGTGPGARIHKPTSHKDVVTQLDPVKKLISLAEHNESRLTKDPEAHYNGIACPQCGHELIDSSPDIVLTTYPPQTAIKCLVCDYSGNRLM